MNCSGGFYHINLCFNYYEELSWKLMDCRILVAIRIYELKCRSIAVRSHLLFPDNECYQEACPLLLKAYKSSNEGPEHLGKMQIEYFHALY